MLYRLSYMGIWRPEPRCLHIDLRYVFPLEKGDDATRSRICKGRLASSPVSDRDGKSSASAFSVKGKMQVAGRTFRTTGWSGSFLRALVAENGDGDESDLAKHECHSSG